MGLLGVLATLLLLSSIAPAWAATSAPALVAPSLAPPLAPAPHASLDDFDSFDGGACGDEEEQEPQELIHCGAEISVFDRPTLLGVLRESIQRMTPGQCLELLDDLYDREMCRVGGRECGDLLPLGLPPIAPKSISSSSSSAQSWLERIAVVQAGSQIVGPRASNDRTPRARAIAPPDRPPRSLRLG